MQGGGLQPQHDHNGVLKKELRPLCGTISCLINNYKKRVVIIVQKKFLVHEIHLTLLTT